MICTRKGETKRKKNNNTSFFTLLTHEWSHIRSQFAIFCKWCQDLFRPLFPCTPNIYTTTLVTLNDSVNFFLVLLLCSIIFGSIEIRSTRA